MSDFIERLTVKNYGPINDVAAKLTPLHAFIGPNDSGKSTLLRAMRTVTQFAGGTVSGGPIGDSVAANQELQIEVTYPDSLTYAICYRPKKKNSRVMVELTKESDTGPIGEWDRGGWNSRGILESRHEDDEVLSKLSARLRPAVMLRLDPDDLRRPSKLLTQDQPVAFENERGAGLPAVYDAIINRDVEAFLPILGDVRRLFPSVRNVRLVNISAIEKAVEVTLTDGRKVTAQFMSEGFLYYLAFAALPYIERPSVILIEEPENGLHPARIAEVMRVLREVSKTTQVLLATHSPLVINEMQPEEVSVVTRTEEEGTKVTPIVETHNFKKRSSVYALGELWLSYANGVDEAPLLEGEGGSEQ